MSFVKDILYEQNLLFAALTETWLNPHNDAEVNIENYTIFRSDRIREKKKTGRYSGSVALYIRDDIASNFKILCKYSNGVNELLVTYSQTLNLFIAVIYRQPNDKYHGHPSNSTEFAEMISKLKKCLEKFTEKIPDIIFCGDFNLPNIEWSDMSEKNGISGEERKMFQILKSLSDEYLLTQSIQQKTHRDGNILDLCFTNNSYLVHSLQFYPNSISHHYTIQMATHLQTRNQFLKQQIP